MSTLFPCPFAPGNTLGRTSGRTGAALPFFVTLAKIEAHHPQIGWIVRTVERNFVVLAPFDAVVGGITFITDAESVILLEVCFGPL